MIVRRVPLRTLLPLEVLQAQVPNHNWLPCFMMRLVDNDEV